MIIYDICNSTTATYVLQIMCKYLEIFDEIFIMLTIIVIPPLIEELVITISEVKCVDIEILFRFYEQIKINHRKGYSF